jgi:2-polyprenyl-3-methyl-5-hydroxy-6-metoxy-1,4-benzoquinol methylase
MAQNAHKTAITRNKLSVPTRILRDKSLLVGRVLDYGCGKGFDAVEVGAESFDPFFQPDMPEGQFDTVYCNYVLNVVEPVTEPSIIEGIRAKLRPGGRAYLTVRRDIKTEGITSKRTFQRNVTLDLPVLCEKKGAFCTYVLEAA